MADILLLFPSDKSNAALRLAEAMEGDGYRVDKTAVEPEDFVERASEAEASAILLLWSRPLISAAVHEGLLGRLRQQARLIEISADGLTPPSPDGRVILICGWRGQPFHPGWQQIQSELKRLLGAGGQISRMPALAAGLAARNADPSRQSGGRARSRTLFSARRLAFILIPAGLAAGAIALGTTMIQKQASDHDVVETARPVQTLPTPKLPPAEPATPPSPAPLPAPAAPLRPVEQPSRAKGPEADASTSKTNRPVEAKPRAKATDAPKNRLRYSPRYSETMRLFCERSGKATPQCRAFRQATRRDR